MTVINVYFLLMVEIIHVLQYKMLNWTEHERTEAGGEQPAGHKTRRLALAS